MRSNVDDARDLIDLVATVIDSNPTRAEQYAAARELLHGYHSVHPERIYPLSRAVLYLTLRLDLARQVKP